MKLGLGALATIGLPVPTTAKALDFYAKNLIFADRLCLHDVPTLSGVIKRVPTERQDIEKIRPPFLLSVDPVLELLQWANQRDIRVISRFDLGSENEANLDTLRSKLSVLTTFRNWVRDNSGADPEPLLVLDGNEPVLESNYPAKKYAQEVSIPRDQVISNEFGFQVVAAPQPPGSEPKTIENYLNYSRRTWEETQQEMGQEWISEFYNLDVFLYADPGTLPKPLEHLWRSFIAAKEVFGTCPPIYSTEGGFKLFPRQVQQITTNKHIAGLVRWLSTPIPPEIPLQSVGLFAYGNLAFRPESDYQKEDVVSWENFVLRRVGPNGTDNTVILDSLVRFLGLRSADPYRAITLEDILADPLIGAYSDGAYSDPNISYQPPHLP